MSVVRTWLAVAACSLALAGCADETASEPSPEETTVEPTPSSSPTGSPTPASGVVGAAVADLATSLGVDPTAVEYVHLLPNLLVSAHPDYVMTHRLLPLAPGRTWVECSWYLRPGPDGTVPDPSYAVEFWDLTNRQDWAACESVQHGLASPHFSPGPFAPNEDAVARFVGMVARAYAGEPLTTVAP